MIVEKVNKETGEVKTIYESESIQFTPKSLDMPGIHIELSGDMYEFREGKPVEVPTDEPNPAE